MSIVNLAVRVSLFMGVIFGAIFLLPDASTVPVPSSFSTDFMNLLGQLYAFNTIFPIYVLLGVAFANLGIVIYTRFVYPIVLMLIGWVRNILGGS